MDFNIVISSFTDSNISLPNSDKAFSYHIEISNKPLIRDSLRNTIQKIVSEVKRCKSKLNTVNFIIDGYNSVTNSYVVGLDLSFFNIDKSVLDLLKEELDHCEFNVNTTITNVKRLESAHFFSDEDTLKIPYHIYKHKDKQIKINFNKISVLNCENIKVHLTTLYSCIEVISKYSIQPNKNVSVHVTNCTDLTLLNIIPNKVYQDNRKLLSLPSLTLADICLSSIDFSEAEFYYVFERCDIATEYHDAVPLPAPIKIYVENTESCYYGSSISHCYNLSTKDIQVYTAKPLTHAESYVTAKNIFATLQTKKPDSDIYLKFDFNPDNYIKTMDISFYMGDYILVDKDTTKFNMFSPALKTLKGSDMLYYLLPYSCQSFLKYMIYLFKDMYENMYQYVCNNTIYVDILAHPEFTYWVSSMFYFNDVGSDIMNYYKGKDSGVANTPPPEDDEIIIHTHLGFDFAKLLNQYTLQEAWDLVNISIHHLYNKMNTDTDEYPLTSFQDIITDLLFSVELSNITNFNPSSPNYLIIDTTSYLSLRLVNCKLDSLIINTLNYIHLKNSDVTFSLDLTHFKHVSSIPANKLTHIPVSTNYCYNLLKYQNPNTHEYFAPIPSIGLLQDKDDANLIMYLTCENSNVTYLIHDIIVAPAETNFVAILLAVNNYKSLKQGIYLEKLYNTITNIAKLKVSSVASRILLLPPIIMAEIRDQFINNPIDPLTDSLTQIKSFP